jgi:hypothetical protein
VIGAPAVATRPGVVATLVAAYSTETPWLTLAALQSALMPTEGERAEAEAQVIGGMRAAARPAGGPGALDRDG